jgi:hypothetical protein
MPVRQTGRVTTRRLAQMWIKLAEEAERLLPSMANAD